MTADNVYFFVYLLIKTGLFFFPRQMGRKDGGGLAEKEAGQTRGICLCSEGKKVFYF